MRCERVDPQPQARLLPYADPLNGLFWAEAMMQPYDSRHWQSPDWPNCTCVQVKEITGNQAESVNREVEDTRLNCYGPGCPTGSQGCNAMGCFGERQRLTDRMGGMDVWVWLDIDPLYPCLR